MENRKVTPLEFATREYMSVWEDYALETPITSALLHRRLTASRPQRRTTTTPPPTSLKTLQDVQSWLGDCRRCGLCETRQSIVFGEGASDTRLLFIGEGPGADEDAQGLPFVGRAGQLLNKILEAMNYDRKQVYIGNVVKCRPPNNRVPSPDEIASCLPFLKAQIDIVNPSLIVALGLTAATTLTGQTTTMSNLRGRFHPLAWNPEIRVLPTYHPAYLLRNPEAKRVVWDDMKLILAQMGKTGKVQ